VSTPDQPLYVEPTLRSGNPLARAALLLGAAFFILALFMSGWFVRESNQRNGATVFATPYQAILLSNGAVYFGKLEGYGTPHPVLTNAFYVVNQTDPQTKAVSSVLVKRGKEMHGPDRMYLNPNQIVFVETVGANSKVAQLISGSSN
jgi:hypothetical protein